MLLNIYHPHLSTFKGMSASSSNNLKPKWHKFFHNFNGFTQITW